MSPRSYVLLTFDEFTNILNKGGSANSTLFNGLEVLSAHKTKLFAEIFSKNSNIDNSGISFLSGTNLKMHNILLALIVVKNFKTDLHSSKVSGSDCIHAVLLKNYKPELSCILANLFNICLKESYFGDC